MDATLRSVNLPPPPSHLLTHEKHQMSDKILYVSPLRVETTLPLEGDACVVHAQTTKARARKRVRTSPPPNVPFPPTLCRVTMVHAVRRARILVRPGDGQGAFRPARMRPGWIWRRHGTENPRDIRVRVGPFFASKRSYSSR